MATPDTLAHGNRTLHREPRLALIRFGAPLSRAEAAEHVQPHGLALADDAPTDPASKLHVLGAKLALHQLLAHGTAPVGRLFHTGKLRRASDVRRGGVSADPELIVNHSGQHYWVRATRGGGIEHDVLEKLTSAKGRQVEWAVHAYRIDRRQDAGALVAPNPTSLMVRHEPNPNGDVIAALADLLNKYGLRADDDVSKLLPTHVYAREAKAGADVAFRAHAALASGRVRPALGSTLDIVPFLHPLQGVLPAATGATDPAWASQTNMRGEVDPTTAELTGAPGIFADRAWTQFSARGAPEVWVCVIDNGMDLRHPDLDRDPNNVSWKPPNDFALGSGNGPKDHALPTNTSDADAGHGTAIAGLAVALHSNSDGAAGVADGCSLMSLQLESYALSEIAGALGFASLSIPSVAHGDLAASRRVVVLGACHDGYDTDVTDDGIDAAHTAGLLVVVPAGNRTAGSASGSGGASGPIYPAGNEHVITVGAINENGHRMSGVGGDDYASAFNPSGTFNAGSPNTTGVALVAPGKDLATTDATHFAGYDAGQSWTSTFGGTCAAAAQVAGVAALVWSQDTTLSNDAVRDTLFRTAHKLTGPSGTPYTYAPQSSAPPGTPSTVSSFPLTWNPEVGFGLVNALDAVDGTYVMIRDDAGDQGVEPSTGSHSWRDGDMVLIVEGDPDFAGPLSDAQFDGHVGSSRSVEKDKKAALYVRVTNVGPNKARNVVVGAVAALCGSGFEYPEDYQGAGTGPLDVYVPATPFSGNLAELDAGSSHIFRFELSAADATAIWDEKCPGGRHFCLLGNVSAENDYHFNETAAHPGGVKKYRSLAQLNVHVATPCSPFHFVFKAGQRRDSASEHTLELTARGTPADLNLRLAFDGIDDALERELDQQAERYTKLHSPQIKPRSPHGFVFLNPSKVRGALGNFHGTFDLAPGSRLDVRGTRADVLVGKLVTERDGRQYVEPQRERAVVRLSKEPHRLYAMELQADIPADARPGDRFPVDVVERDANGEVVGGFTVLFTVP